MTEGKTELHFEICSNGPIWGYGTNWEQYQKPMTEFTRGIYRVYTHTDPTFVPPIYEKQGFAPANPPVRSTPGPEVFAVLEARVNEQVDQLLSSRRALNQMGMQFLARAYHVNGIRAFNNPKVVSKVTDGLDQLFHDFRLNVRLMESDPSTPNPGWFGFGPAGDAVWLLSNQLRPSLDLTITDTTG